MVLEAAPGTYIAEKIEEKTNVLVGEKKAQIKKGLVVSVGASDFAFGQRIPSPVKVGDIVLFLSYDGAYDEFYIDGKTYYTVVGKDHRAVIK